MRVELPLKAGADKSRRDRDGQTALQLAAAIEDKKTRDFVTYLPLTMGREDGAALKPWMLDSAAQRGQTGVAEMLLRLGADPKKSNPKATPR